MIKCYYCHLFKEVGYYKKTINNTKTYVCRECNTLYCKKYRSTLKGKIATRKAVRKYESLNKIRKRAWGKCQKINIKPCSVCGKTPSHRHHPDINEPLNVIFLCPLHYRQVHLGKIVI